MKVRPKWIEDPTEETNGILFHHNEKVIAIGLDGFEPKIAEAMIARRTPNLMITEQGGYSAGATHSAQRLCIVHIFTGTNPAVTALRFSVRDPKHICYLALSVMNKERLVSRRS
jgi:hypothetical protein